MSYTVAADTRAAYSWSQHKMAAPAVLLVRLTAVKKRSESDDASFIAPLVVLLPCTSVHHERG